jgi:2-haloacid dehalogenase
MQSDSPHVNRRRFLKTTLSGAVGALTTIGSVSAADPHNAEPMKDRPEVLFFDVNETLLDLRQLKASISEALGGRENLVPLWLTTMLQYSLVATVADRYANFIDIGIATLQMVAGSNGVPLSEADAKKAIEPISSLPPHPEVPGALRSLKSAGYRMFTITNSSKAGITAQMKNSGLGEFFAEFLTVEEIGIYKPATHVYRWAARRAGVETGSCMLIAAHGWDVAGALWADMRAAFLARPGQQLYPLAPEPEIVAPDLAKAAEALVAVSSGSGGPR